MNQCLWQLVHLATKAGQKLHFASTVAGEVLPINIGETGDLSCQKGAFLCAEPSIELSSCIYKEIFHQVSLAERVLYSGYYRNRYGIS